MTKAVFLDLQGTLGGQGLDDITDFSFFPNAIEAIKVINDLGLLAIVVTNQSGISRGHLMWEDFIRKIDELKRELDKQGAKFDAVYCCPHTKEDNCSCRKPFPGMAIQAQKDFCLDLSECYLVGDCGAWDMVLAKNIGCKAILVLTGLGQSSLNEYRYLWPDIEPDYIARDILDAIKWITMMEENRPRF